MQRYEAEVYTTTINSIAAGNTNPITETMSKCKSFEEWIIYVGAFMLILIIVLFKYKSLLPLIDPLIKCIMQRFLTVQELDIDGENEYETMEITTEL